MNTAETKFMIISNFLDYMNYPEKDELLTMARDYVNQDHVDEIAQAMGFDPIDSYTYSIIDCKHARQHISTTLL